MKKLASHAFIMDALLAGLVVAGIILGLSSNIAAQEEAAAASTSSEPPQDGEAAPEPLNEDELEVLVARIALYPDELVAVIASGSLFPLQLVEAARFLDEREKNPSLQPKSTWDGSVVSLLNYPDIIRMMSEDLDWTQALGEAISYQQKDVLEAIQQLRDKAVADGIIKSDDKVKVVEENDNIIIQPASQEVVYVPQYEPEMLYVPDYAPTPIAYYPEPYPSYYYPGATFFAGAVTGAVWASVVDWDDWGVWGGNWGNDVDIDCNNCFNNRDFNGKVNINDVDWRNVDRSKIKLDKNQLNKIDRNKVKNDLKTNDRNNVKNKSADLRKTRANERLSKSNKVKDVRKSTVDGLKAEPTDRKAAKPAGKGPEMARPSAKQTGKIDRPVGKPKAAAKPDKRPKNPSALGDVNSGQKAKSHSSRGQQAMGGGMKKSGGGGQAKQFKKPMPKAGGRRR